MSDPYEGSIRAAFLDSAERTALASSIYDSLKVTGQLAQLKPLTYRCEHRCSLLDVFDTPEGLVIGFPRYKTSPDVTEATSSPSGRQKNTDDGWRRWRRHAAFSDNVSRPALSCDHLRMVVLEDESISADLSKGAREVRVRPDGSRYAV